MKESKYNFKTSLDENTNIIYNTLNRSYLVYLSKEEGRVKKILNDKKGKNDKKIFDTMVQKGMIIEKDFDELAKMKFIEQQGRYQDQTFRVVIQPTLDCNFRCVYCYEEHKKQTMDYQIEDRVLKFIKGITTKVKKINVTWFGGEPTLEDECIIRMSGRIQEACEENKCNYEAIMVSNGYLLDEEMLNAFRDVGIKRFQITVDGIDGVHDKLRPFKDGTETFKIIKKNIITMLEKELFLTLRVNINDQNYEKASEILEIIPEELRNRVTICFMNIFQEEKKSSLYQLYKQAIEMGYQYNGISKFKMIGCELCGKNGLTIEPTGKVVPCSIAAEEGEVFGQIDEGGNISLNGSFYYELKSMNALENKNCQECVKFPMCMGGCAYRRLKSENKCCSYNDKGLTLGDEIKLQYYYDNKKNENII